MKNYLINILLRLLEWLGHKTVVQPPAIVHVTEEIVVDSKHGLSDGLFEHTQFAVEHVAKKFPNTSGELKRAQAFRVLLNLEPEVSHRDLGLAIELCLRP
jgi:hypothetical protein